MTYYCADTHCKVVISIDLNIDKNNLNNSILKYKNIQIINKHSLLYKNHNFARKQEIKNDINNLGKISIVKKCKDYNYLINFIKEIAIKNEYLCYKIKGLEDYINTNYKGIVINYDSIDKEIIKTKEKLYKIQHKNNTNNNKEIDIKEISKISTISSSISSQIKKYFSRNKNLHTLLCNISYNDINISTFLEVNFTRNNKQYKKNIYFYITNKMKNTLKNKESISQWFMDCTYYAVPRNNNNYKLLLLIGFNKEENKTYLGAIVLLKNENIETFTIIFNYLQEKYGFTPKCINIDCSSAEIISIKKNFQIVKLYYVIIIL